MKKFLLAVVMTAAVAGTSAGCGIVGGKDIGKDAALQAALDDAGVQESDTTRLKVSEDRDDGRKVYEIQFDADNTEFEYEIQASDGTILSVDKESISTGNNTGSADTGTDTASGNSQGSQDGTGNQYGNQNGNAGNNAAVSWDEAMQIALERVPGASEQDVRMEFDQDHRECKYEGEIIYNNIEYEFEIDANSGTILEWSEERH